MNPLMSLLDVSLTYPQQPPLFEHLSLSLMAGDFVVLVGPSGCGKTSLLHLMAGYLTPQSGSILLGGEVVTQPDPRRGVVFQDPTLFPWLSAEENVVFGPRMQHMEKEKRTQLIQQALSQVGMEASAKKYPHELSGGMKQRIALARTLVNQPQVMLMDEPLSALDAKNRRVLQQLLVKVWQKEETTILMITHDLDEALLVGTKLWVMGADHQISLERSLSFQRYLFHSDDPLSDEAYRSLRHDIMMRIG